MHVLPNEQLSINFTCNQQLEFDTSDGNIDCDYIFYMNAHSISSSCFTNSGVINKFDPNVHCNILAMMLEQIDD